MLNLLAHLLKGQICMQQHLFEHFASESYCSFVEDLLHLPIRLSLKIQTNANIIGGIHLRQMAPLGLNVEDD